MIGQLVGHYRVLEKIGAGGMGEVYRARDERLGRDVALKLIRPASGESPDVLRRFEQEARAAAALNHPSIVAIYDVGFEGTTPYIVCELLQGTPLRQRLSAGPMPVREATDYAQQIVQGLIAAHDRHIVHRDLKPENLFVTTEGRIKILDFGVAKLQIPAEDGRSIESLTTVTKSGTVIGTVAYMSPEQLRAKPVDQRSDIFSFGATLYEMLTGKRAFRGETEVDTMTAVLREEPPEINLERAAIPSGYRDIVKHCLEKEPENRFQSARDLAFAIQAVSGSSSGSQARFPRPRSGRKLVLPWAIAGALAAVAVVLALTLRRPTPPPSYQRVTFESGTVYAARFSPDGQSIVYSAAWNGRPTQLFSTVGNSLQSQSLALTDASLLAVSRKDELAIVVRGYHTGQLETINGVLASTPLAGGSPHELLSDVRWADWDGAGKLAVVHYVDGRSQLEYPVGTVLYQSRGWISHIRFSPNHDLIAFIDHPVPWDDRGGVCVVERTGQLRTLTEDWESTSGLAWSPNGNEIWFTAASKGNNLDLLAVNLSGRERKLLDLPVAITLQDVSADGRVLVSLNSKRLAMNFGTVTTTEEENLSWHDWNIAKDISSDGQSVLFEDASELSGMGYAVALRKLDGSLPVRLGEGSAGGISPDGKWAISISTGNPEQVALLPVGTGQPKSLDISALEHVQNGWARFLPSGEAIILNGNEPGHAARCYLLNLAGGKPKALTPEDVRCGPSSPDGRFLVGVGANSSVGLYPMGGGAARSVPGIERGFRPVQWSADGSALYGYYEGELPGRIYRIDLASGKKALLQELHPGAPAGVVNISPVVVSRDGKRFAYSYNQTLSVLYVISGVR
jgi:eukaryotic-like serine/threonine-protein kinase